MKVYEALAAACLREDPQVAFGLVGDGNVKFVDHLSRRCGLRYVATRHESAAVAMAAGYSRATGRPGLATLTQGPGFTNGLTALTAAAKGRIPMVLLTGLPPTGLPGHPQAIDQARLLALCGAGHQQVHPNTLALDVGRAFTRAQDERRPIAICVPTDVQDAELPGDPFASLSPSPPPHPNGSPLHATCEALGRAADAIEAARRPLVLAGRGVLASPRAREALVRLADRSGALLATTLPIRGFFAGHPFAIGVMGGFAPDRTIAEVGQSDCILAFGASLNYRSTGTGKILDPHAVVVQCDLEEDPAGASVGVDLRLVGDAAATADALSEELERRGFSSEGGRSEALARDIRAGALHDPVDDRSVSGQVDPRALMQRLDALLPEQRSLTVDGGHCSGFPSIYLRVPDHHGYLFSLEFASIGLGLGTAMGAALGRPDRLSVLVVGDGSLMMSLPDLETAVRSRIPLLVIVMNDQAYGSELAILEASGLPPEVGLFANPDFAAVAEALGAAGTHVRSLADLDEVAARLPCLDGPLLVDCAVDPQVRGTWLAGAFDRTLSLR